MKKFQPSSLILLVAVLFTSSVIAQDWVKMMQDPTVNFYDVQKAFNQYYHKAEKKIERKQSKLANRNEEEENEVPGTSIYKRWEWFMQPRVGANGERFSPDALYKSMQAYKKNYNTMGAGNWTFLGPATSSSIAGAGRINNIRINPSNSNTLYVLTPEGGLWTSTNGGSSWSTNNTDFLPQIIGCTDLAFDPTNSQIMYLATGDGDAGDTYSVGLLKSTDGGVTWNPTGLSFNPAQ